MGGILKISAFVLLLVGACGSRRPAAASSYADGAAGLRAFMADLAAAGDGPVAHSMAESLRLTDPAAFFARYYAPEITRRLATEYQAHPPRPALLIGWLREQKARGRTEVLVEKFERVDDENATGYQEHALEAQLVPLPLYSFRLRAPTQSSGQHLFNFVYVEGAWKLAGPMKSIKDGLMNDPRMDALSGLRAKDRDAYFTTGRLPD